MFTSKETPPTCYYQSEVTVFQKFNLNSWLSAFALILFTLLGTPVNAQNEAIQDFENWTNRLENIGIKFSNGYIHYDEKNQTLTIPDVEVNFSSTIALEDQTIEKYEAEFFLGFPDSPPEIKFDYKFTATEIIFNGISTSSNRISFDAINYSNDLVQEFKFELENVGTLEVTQISSELSFQNISYLIPSIDNRSSISGVTQIQQFINHWGPNSFESGKNNKDSFEISLNWSEIPNNPIFSMTTKQINTQMYNLREGILGEITFENYQEFTKYPYDDLKSDTLVNQESTTETVSYKGINLNAWLELFLPNSTNSNRVNLVEESKSVNYQSKSNGDTFSASEISLKGLSHQSNNVDVFGIFLIFMTSQSFNKEVMAFDFFDVVRGLGIESFFINNIETEIELPEESSKIQVNVDLVEATNLSSSKFGEISVRGFNSQDSVSTGTISFDKFSIGNLVFPELEPMKPYILGTKLEDIEKGGFESARVFLPRSLQIELSNLNVNLPEDGFVFKLENLYHSFETKIPPIPTSLFLEVNKFEVPVHLLHEADVQNFLAKSGIEKLSISHKVDFKWNEKTNEAVIDNLSIEVGELGRLTASIQLDEIPRSIIENPFNAFQTAFVAVMFNKAEIKFEDYGLTETLLSSLATDTGANQEDTKKFLTDLIKAELQENLANERFSEIFDEEFSKFLDDPNTFVLSLSPEKPVPIVQLFGSLIAPGILPDILNAKVKAVEK